MVTKGLLLEICICASACTKMWKYSYDKRLLKDRTSLVQERQKLLEEYKNRILNGCQMNEKMHSFVFLAWNNS